MGKAFQKQPAVFLNKKKHAGAKVSKTGKDVRWTKNVGLGIKTPREAIEGTYIDKMSFHWRCGYPRTSVERHSEQHENEAHTYHQTRLPPLHQEVQQVREASQEHLCSRFSSLP